MATDHASSTDREARLPQWAQHELALLRRQLHEAREAVTAARLATSPDETDTLVDPLTDEGLIGVPRGSYIRFRVDGGYFHARVIGNRLDITSHAARSNNDGLIVYPRVMNGIQVGMGH